VEREEAERRRVSNEEEKDLFALANIVTKKMKVSLKS